MQPFRTIIPLLQQTDTTIDIHSIVEFRRAHRQREGYDTSRVNWEHYEKVLLAKREKQKNEH